MRAACFEDITFFTGLNERAREMFRFSAQPHQTRLRGMRGSGNPDGRNAAAWMAAAFGREGRRGHGRPFGAIRRPSQGRWRKQPPIMWGGYAAPDAATGCNNAGVCRPAWMAEAGNRGRCFLSSMARLQDRACAPSCRTGHRFCRFSRRAAAPRASRRVFAGSGVWPGPPAVGHRACAALPSTAR